ncbi:MAG: hypothetical protein ACTHJ5_12200, partial [Ilyomonas sp.]
MIKKFCLAFPLMFLFLYSNAQKKYTFEKPKMGSPFVITIYTNDSVKAAAIAAKAFQLVDSLNNILSDYI